MGTLIDLLLPTCCLYCERLSERVCRGCLSKVANDPRLVFREGLVGFATMGYTSEAKALLRSFKELGESQLGTLIGESLVPLMACFNRQPTRLVPVPSNVNSLRERGFNPAEVIARELSKNFTNLPYENLLRRTLETRDQSKLNPRERAENQLGSMLALGGRHEVVLVDDVVTTGATLLTAAETLKNAGHLVLGFVTFAETEAKRCNLTTQAPFPVDGGTSWNSKFPQKT